LESVEKRPERFLVPADEIKTHRHFCGVVTVVRNSFPVLRDLIRIARKSFLVVREKVRGQNSTVRRFRETRMSVFEAERRI